MSAVLMTCWVVIVLVNAPLPPLILEGELVTSAGTEGELVTPNGAEKLVTSDGAEELVCSSVFML